MEKVTEGPRSHPFNSALETGIRALVILEAFHPRLCDLTELTWFDHLVVHTGDIPGEDVPISLHPDLPNRTGELLVRRRLIEDSLRLMQRMHLVDVVDGAEGIGFTASEDAPSFLALLKAPYTLELKKRAAWLAAHFASLSKATIRDLVDEKIGRWTAEFRIPHASTS
ncbi:hypothetical protein QRQ56_19570 [Bradyrhizobium sp. U531]|uniref:ABC-three component system middle component 2 n=1 Tax=Bradyrhizobium sp. U531 TaxID=3053458 RepID=UPI003F422AE9